MYLTSFRKVERLSATRQQFTSDNYAGVCPEAISAFVEANIDDARAYGEDDWTERAASLFRELFEVDCEVFFVFNGTAANSLALAALCQSYHGVLCADNAHVETDECGAPEFFSNGSKLITVPTTNGKLTPLVVQEAATRRNDIHFPRPRTITISQSTETGQVYLVREVEALATTAHNLGMQLHMDGARFANACAFLGCHPADITWRAGVDVLCFGGTKNGMAVGEAIVFFDKRLSNDFEYRCKQAGQLASKMRFLAAPWIGLFETGAWLRNAKHANQCAQRLVDQVSGKHGVEILFPVEANAVFLKLGMNALAALRAKGWGFYTFIGGGARFMFSWNSSIGDVDQLARDILSGS